MRVVTTDISMIWAPDNPALEEFKDVLLVVCLEGKAITDKYECFVSPFKPIGMGVDKSGTEDLRLKALESVADELTECLGYNEDILFLTDGNPQSLYPYYVMKDRSESGYLHLFAISPWRVDLKRRIYWHNELLSDLSKLTSVLYMDSDKYMDNATPQTTISVAMQEVKKDCAALLPVVVNSISNLSGSYYFDFSTNSYVAVQEGFNGIVLFEEKSPDTQIETDPEIDNNMIVGMVMPPEYKKEDDWTKEEIERLPARIDGKSICNYLRMLRIKLAEANGIEFQSEECPSVGPCAGTCDKCDQEAAYLREKLSEIPSENRIIPDCSLTSWREEL